MEDEYIFTDMCTDDEKLAQKERADSIDSGNIDTYSNSCPKCHVRECNSLRFESIVNATVFTETELQEMIDEGVIDENDENNGVGLNDVVNFQYPYVSPEKR